jgi:hypothetical protein
MIEHPELITVAEHSRALAIVRLLEKNGIRHVELWPEDMLSQNIGLVIGSIGQPMPRLRPKAAPSGPFHLFVAAGELDAAREILARPGAEAQLVRLGRPGLLARLLWRSRR